jgi:hypothetical protein
MRRQGRRNRLRGQETERYVENELKREGATEVEKSREYHRPRSWDVRGVFGRTSLYIQVKRKKTWNVVTRIIDKMKGKQVNVVFYHVDFHENFVMLRWTDFLKLLKNKPMGQEKDRMEP